MSQSIEIPFAIGSDAWFVNTDRTHSFVPCPECAGTRRHTVILGCGATVTVECAECEVREYSDDARWRSPGTVAVYSHGPKIERVTLGSVYSLDGAKVHEYLSNRDSRGSCTIYPVARLFADRADAEAVAVVLAEDRTREENATYEQRMNYRRRAGPADIARKPTWLRKNVRELRENLEKAEAALAYAVAANKDGIAARDGKAAPRG